MHYSCLFFGVMVLVSFVQAEDKSLPVLGEAHSLDKSFRLVWQEEFHGTQLDRKKWMAEDSWTRYGYTKGILRARKLRQPIPPGFCR